MIFDGTSQAEAEQFFAQPAPTGNGRIVLLEAITQCCVGSEDIAVMLLERAIKGREKYKTWLRSHSQEPKAKALGLGVV